MEKGAAPLVRFKLLWLSFGYLLIALILYLSLTSHPVDLGLEIKFKDKFFHAFAYFVLMFWFAQIYHDRLWRYGYAVVFVLMGVGIEYLQGLDPQRYFELADMAANATGVALALLLALSSAQYVLVGIEKKLFFQNK